MKKYLTSLIIISSFVLAGCGSVTTPNYYLLPNLNVPDDTVSLFDPESTVHVGVATVSMPAYLERPQIVLLDADNMHLEVLDRERWAEPLDDGITRLVSELLHQKLSKDNISVLPLRIGVPVDISIHLDIRNFEGKPNRQLLLACTWTLFKKDGNQVDKIKGDFSKQIPAGQTLNELILNQSELLDSLVVELAKAIESTLP